MEEDNRNPGTAMTEIRVCVVSTSKYVFGAEKSMAYLVGYLADSPCLFSLISPGGETESLFRSMGCTDIYRVPFTRFVRRMFPAAWISQATTWVRNSVRVYRLLRVINPTVIHANGIHAALYSIPAARLLHLPLIWHIRDVSQPKRAAWICAKAAARIIVASRSTAEHYSYLGRRMDYVPNPIFGPASADEEVTLLRCERGARNAAMQFPESSESTFKIGLIGQTIPRKGHHILLSALPQILKSVPTAEAHLFGEDSFAPDSEYVRSLRRMIEESDVLRRHVRFHGYTEDIASVYRALDVVVIPSLDEAFGRVALEAMYYGRPVVAANCGGLAETVTDGETGLLFQPGDPQALARCLIELAGSQELRDRLVKGGEKKYYQYAESVRVGVSNVEEFYSQHSTDYLQRRPFRQ